MDWNSEEGRKLLKQAYPAGFLAKRGVLTVGGWMFAQRTTFCGLESWVLSSPGGVGQRAFDEGWEEGWGSIEAQRLRSARDAGDLLPLPDAADVATWACMLADLAAIAPRRSDRLGAVLGYSWVETNPRVWQLSAYGVSASHGYGIGKAFEKAVFTARLDPAEALVRAKISLLEEK